MRELEAEIADGIVFAPGEQRLLTLMAEKLVLEGQLSLARLDAARGGARPGPEFDRLYGQIRRLDDDIAPLVIQSGALGNKVWGPLMRAGNDKSLFARQVEKYADVYTSRVGNFGARTPFAYLRASRTTLPHDQQ